MWAQTLWIYGYAKRYWPAMIFYTLLGMTGTVVSLLSSLVTRDMVDIITGHNSSELVATFIWMIALNVISTIMNMISTYASTWISLKVDAEIKSEIFGKILVTDWEELTNYHTGDLLTRWSSDASQISTGVLSFIPSAIIYVFRFVSTFAMVCYYDWTFAVFAFLGMPVSLILSKTLMRRMINNNERSAAMNARMSGFNQETFSNIQTIKAFGLIKLYVARLKQLQKEYIDMKLDFQRMSVWTSLILTTVGLVVSYACYGWGIYRVWSGAITYGTMTMFLSLSTTLSGNLSNITSLIPTAITLTTSAGRLMDIVEMKRENYDDEDEVAQFAARHVSDGVSLVVENVSYTYKTGTEVFDGASFLAKPKEVVALVGPSGEGKTTMLRLLLALMPPAEGQASFYGGSVDMDSRSLSKAERISLTPSARQMFSYVPQGNTMFSGTIAENMRSVAPEATDEEIIDVLKQACAWDFVERLPLGINSEIKERGGGFSEGQAQRLSIARALIRKAPVLLLDEATSALDVATERKVLRSIMNDDSPRTCIVTTHRPTVLNLCNRVYKINEKQLDVLEDEEIQKMILDF